MAANTEKTDDLLDEMLNCFNNEYTLEEKPKSEIRPSTTVPNQFGRKMRQCPFCEKTYLSRSGLSQHKSIHHSKEINGDMKLPGKQSLSNHQYNSTQTNSKRLKFS